MLKRFGASTKLKTCPLSTGGGLLLAASQLAESRMNSTPTSLILPLKGLVDECLRLCGIEGKIFEQGAVYHRSF
jgi:hypothetical protein